MMTPEELGAELGGLGHDQVLALRRQHNWPSWKAGKVIRFDDEHVKQIKAMHSVAAAPAPAETPITGLVIEGQTARSARRSS